MRHTIPHQELGFFACNIVVVNNFREPLATSSVRLKYGDC